ncbi:MAG TPA: hypothetical protein VJ508_15305, partial [Saprospiraceae bacterium]|nr:hypothetical protein [Saprospiraceae bacterium]
MIPIIIMASLKRNTRWRTFFNWLGIGISSAYLVLTIFNMRHVDDLFKRALANRHIQPIRCQSTATIFNNILWACVAEDQHAYYMGAYSLFDSDPNFHYISVLPKLDSVRTALAGNKDYEKIKWLAHGYLAEFKTDSATYVCDLRYGAIGDTVRNHTDLFMNWKVTEENGKLKFSEYREPLKGGFGAAFRHLWTRIKGY